MKRGLPPRCIDPELLVSVKRADFVIYIQNPHHCKGAPFGAASAAVATLRNTRIKVVAKVKER